MVSPKHCPRLHIDCAGEGSPTVILDAGLGGTSRAWITIQPRVATFTRVCAYDRAGLGASGPGSGPRTSQRIVDELRTALTRSGVDGPYVLVGHSFGGFNTMLYACRYPEEVAGMVLLDAPHQDVHPRFAAVLSEEQREELYEPLRSNPEGVDILASAAEIRAAGRLPDIPAIVLMAGRGVYPDGWPSLTLDRIWRELQESIASRLPRGRLIVAERSGHFIQRDQPDLVVDAIRQVTEAARERATGLC